MAEEEKYPQCPLDNSWLKAMRRILPPRIWARSKLAGLEVCLKEEEKV
jgi:hypothetical protein